MRTSFFVALSTVLLVWGCSSAPTMKDVEEIGPDTQIVFGSTEVWVDEEQETWGTKFTGHNYFYLLVLPADSTEAISYRLDKDGVFFWTLEPGEYTLLGYYWQNLQTVRSGHIGATFVVPEDGPDVYLGSMVFSGNIVYLQPKLEDRFEQVSALYDAQFAARRGTAVKQLFEPPQDIGHFTAVSGQCHDDWKIECTKRFRGVTPITPAVSQSGFPETDSTLPEFRWQACGRQDVSYDLLLYEAATFNIGGALVPQYTRGHIVAYVEDIKEPRWKPDAALRPNTRYYWSVRLRDGSTVSRWSTLSHSTFLLIYASSGYGQWFQFKTS